MILLTAIGSLHLEKHRVLLQQVSSGSLDIFPSLWSIQSGFPLVILIQREAEELTSADARYGPCKMLLRSQNLWKKQTFPNNPPTFLNYSFSSISLRTALENNIGSFLREALNSNTFFVLVTDQPYSFQTLHIWNIPSLESRRWQEAFPFPTWAGSLQWKPAAPFPGGDIWDRVSLHLKTIRSKQHLWDPKLIQASFCCQEY